ncbi:MAG: hypothetical protein AAGF81_21275 [Pseudomonadota bacterium]
MTYDQIAAEIAAASFVPLGSFHPEPGDRVPGAAGTLILIGNAGPRMWQRFSAERKDAATAMDSWTEQVLTELAENLGGTMLFPFATPPLPFLSWAQKARAGFVSPLGLNIHPDFGLWHAFRGALVMPQALILPGASCAPHPCESCSAQPCLSTCPVGAFDGSGYDVDACAAYIGTPEGTDCLHRGCKARRACPVGTDYQYLPEQANFHMSAFLKARQNAP